MTRRSKSHQSHKNVNLSMCFVSSLTNDKLVFLWEIVLGDFQVQRRRSFPHTSRDIVVRTVAWAEPTTKIACFTNRHTTQVSADTQHDQPFGLLDTVFVFLRITENFDATRGENLG